MELVNLHIFKEKCCSNKNCKYNIMQQEKIEEENAELSISNNS